MPVWDLLCLWSGRHPHRGDDTHTRFDFDGDGKADLVVFRPSENNWYIQGSAGGYRVMTWGVSGDEFAAADYDGDGKTDVAVFRPSSGVW